LVLVGPKHGRWVIFVTAMGYLSALHIYRMVNDYMGWKFDITTQVLIIVQRVTAFAWNYYDGTAGKDKAREMPQKGFYEKTYAVEKLPSLLTFLGWTFMPAVFPMGPFVEFVHFEKIANGNLVIPSGAIAHSMKSLGIAVVCLALTQVGAVLFDESVFRDATWLNSHTPLQIFIHTHMLLFFVRTKYYFAFKAVEGSAIISGLGYRKDPVTKEDKWDMVAGVDILNFEFADSYQMASNAWNKQTSVWLKRYIYFRSPRSINRYITYLVSAFWHGFYPGYYMFFLTIAFTTDVVVRVQKLVAPLFANHQGIYKVLCVIATVATMNWFVLSFLVLDFWLTIQFFSASYWFAHIAVVIAFVVLVIWEQVAPPRVEESKRK